MVCARIYSLSVIREISLQFNTGSERLSIPRGSNRRDTSHWFAIALRGRLKAK